MKPSETDWLAAFEADVMGQGSAQATSDTADAGSDDPFWATLNSKVKNLRVVVSGHGTLLYVSFTVSHQLRQIMVMSGASASRRRTSFSASTNILGKPVSCSLLFSF